MNINWNLIPETMGVYMWKSLDDQVIYISKAENIRSAMKLYFFSEDNSGEQIEKKYSKNINGYEFIECKTFEETIELQNNLIDIHRPKMNLKIKSAKKYPYIEMKFKDIITFKVSKTFKIKRMTKYYGPFSDSAIAREIIDLLIDVLDIENFNNSPFNLDYNEINKQTLVDTIFLFFKGETNIIEKEIRDKIILNNKKGDFDESFKYNKYLEFIKYQKETSNKIFQLSDHKDIINFFVKNGVISISVMHIRYGNIQGTSNFVNKKFNPSIYEVIDSFIRKYYKDRMMPDEIICPIQLHWEEFQFKNMKFIHTDPIVLDLLEMTQKHAKIKYATNIESVVDKIKGYDKALKFIKENFVEKEIHNIEMIDFFPLNKNEKMAAVVRFNNGEPNKDEYKKYISESKDIGENINYIEGFISAHFKNKNGKNMPDVFIVKNKTQLEISKKILQEQSIENVIITALDSWNDNIGTLINWEGKEFKFEKDSHIRAFLNKMQDELNKFVIHFHRNRNKENILEMQLDSFLYLSDYDKQKLFKNFKTKTKILNASLKDMQEVIGKDKASKLKEENKNG